MSCTKDDRLWLGLVAFVIGAVVLLQRFNIVPMDTWDYLWPSILVVSGIRWMVVGCGSSSSNMACDANMCGDCGSEACPCDMTEEASAVATKKTSSKKTANNKKK